MARSENFIENRLKSVKYAVKGAFILIKTEASIKIQVVLSILITIAGFVFNISSTEWILQSIAIGLVIGIEGLNTAIEAIADFIHPEHHSKIGHIKDISAGAVFIASISAVIAGLIIYLPKFF